MHALATKSIKGLPASRSILHVKQQVRRDASTRLISWNMTDAHCLGSWSGVGRLPSASAVVDRSERENRLVAQPYCGIRQGHQGTKHVTPRWKTRNDNDNHCISHLSCKITPLLRLRLNKADATLARERSTDEIVNKRSGRRRRKLKKRARTGPGAPRRSGSCLAVLAIFGLVSIKLLAVADPRRAKVNSLRAELEDMEDIKVTA